MATGNPQVQRTGYQMLTGVVDEAEVLRLEGLINDIRTLVEAVRADVIPIAVAELKTNPQFISLQYKLDEFQQRYGFTVPDMDLNLNPIFAEVEHRLDIVENGIIDLKEKYAILADQQNYFKEQLKVIQQKLGIPLP